MVIVACDGGWALHAGIGMITNLPGYPMFFNHENSTTLF